MAFATHILVPTDFSAASRLAVDAAALLARDLGAKITLVHVHDPGAVRAPAAFHARTQDQDLDAELEDAAAAELETLRASALADVADLDTVVLRDESAPHAITTYASKIGADLIVIATHGRTGLKHLLIGSVAERVVRHATMPVLTLRSTAAD